MSSSPSESCLATGVVPQSADTETLRLRGRGLAHLTLQRPREASAAAGERQCVRRNVTVSGRAMGDLEHDIALTRTRAAATAIVENRT